MTEPYIMRQAGDFITAKDWNDIQTKTRDDIQGHRHTGGADGARVPREGIETQAIDGTRIDPETEATVKKLTVSGELKVDGKAILGDVDDLLGKLNILDQDKLATAGGTITGSLTIAKDLSVGANLRVDTGKEILFGDNGQIRSLDNNHRILFRRSENKLELREYGDLVFSPGATQGAETAKVVMHANGNVDIQGNLAVTGVVRADTVEATNPLRHRMYPAEPIVYQEIFDAKKQGAISKLGNPNYDDTAYKKNPWYGHHLIRYGNNNEADGNGAEVAIPAGYDTVWVRVLGDRWTAIKAYFLDHGKEDLGLWAGGYRSANGFCPDGSLSDGFNDAQHAIEGGSTLRVDLHQWLPIPVRRAGKLALVAKPHTNRHFWLSGLAFSRNPWAHAAQSAFVYHWKLNGGTDVKWNNHNWNQDVLAEILPNKISELMVPVVPSGRDKLLYLIEHNNNWNGCGHTGITVNGKPIERLMATYDNPFARHWSSKFYERYIAARIPANLIPKNARYLSVRLDQSTQNMSIYFREIGTHDLDIPRIA